MGSFLKAHYRRATHAVWSKNHAIVAVTLTLALFIIWTQSTATLRSLTTIPYEETSISTNDNVPLTQIVNITLPSWQQQQRQQQQLQKIHIVVVADAAFAKRYQPVYQKMREYATSHGYSWTLLNKSHFARVTHTDECFIYENFFFWKHCWVAAWMEREHLSPTADVVFVVDSDVLPYRSDLGLERWAASEESIVLYTRGWSNENAAGNYMVRNTAAARSFLRSWAQYQFHQPRGFSSADNGALHIHLLRTLGFEGWEPLGKCGSLYSRLHMPVTNLTDYWDYITCTRQQYLVVTNNTESNQIFRKGDFSMRLLSHKSAFVIDAFLETEPSSTVPGPVFHHGVKIRNDGTVANPEYLIRYNLTLDSNYDKEG